MDVAVRRATPGVHLGRRRARLPVGADDAQGDFTRVTPVDELVALVGVEDLQGLGLP